MFKYSPVDVKDKIVNLLPELSFFQPYIDGVFDNDPKRGRITVGVRTPWYDIVYLEVSSGSFSDHYVGESGLNAIIAEVSGDLDAAVSIQTEFGQGAAMRLDKSELAEYLKDPGAYIKNRRENKLSKPTYKLPRIYPTVYVNHDNTLTGRTLLEQPNNRDFDVYVHHNSNWSEHSMMDAETVIFLCDCDSCVTRMKRVRESRGEDSDKATRGRYPYGDLNEDEKLITLEDRFKPWEKKE